MGIKFNHVYLERVEEVFHRRVVMAAAGAAHRRRGLHRSQLARRRTEGFRSVRLCPAIKDRAQWRVYGEPAVGNKERAGNERRLIRGEDKRCIRHIFRLAQASQMEGLDPWPYNVTCDHRSEKRRVGKKRDS